MIYYIYHIPGIKIGCTDDVQRRMKRQGFTSWEILEEHTDGWLAGDRELELQKEYGLPVDNCHYMISVSNRVASTEVCVRGGKTQGDINAANGHMKRIQKENAHIGAQATNSIRKQCNICGYESTPAGIYQHNKKCK